MKSVHFAMNPIIINNKKVFAFSSEKELLDKLDNYKGLLIALGAEKLLNDDKNLASIINNSLTYCDGYGAVFALKRRGVYSVKIPGAYLWLSLIEKYCNEKIFYILGSTNETILKTKNKLEKEFPKIKIVGFRNGYFNNNDDIIKELTNLKPDIVFVALGSPKQEFFMNQAMKSHSALYMGLGGSFDLYVGKAKKVPLLWNKIFKWEGLYRSLSDITNFKRMKRQKLLLNYIYALLIKKI